MSTEAMLPGEQQFEELLMSLLDSNEDATVSMLTSAFIGVMTGVADSKTNTVGQDILIVCGEYQVTIQKVEEVPDQLH